jgi:DMSO/TMAO reductase YedYZ heme-binding membrane subunit
VITRVSGITATVGFVAVAVFGLLLARRFGGQSSKTKMRLHRQLSELSIGALAIHLTAAQLDRRHVPLYALVAPFLSPVRTVAAGTGSLAAWGLLIVAFTGAARKRFKRSWRTIHYLAYPAMGFVVFHSVLGSDRRQVVAWGVVAAAVLIVRALMLKQPTMRAISQSVTIPDALGDPVGVGAMESAPIDRSARRNGLGRIRAGLGRLGGADKKWVAAAVVLELISYGCLAVHLRRLAASKWKKR